MRKIVYMKKVPGAPNYVFPPTRATTGAVGYDLHAATSMDIAPGEIGVIGTGYAIQLPYDTVGMVCGRSGLASRGIFPANSPGIIDPDYRGEVNVILYNASKEVCRVDVNDRIAQLVIVPFSEADFELVEELDDTVRGARGLGSTGTEPIDVEDYMRDGA